MCVYEFRCPHCKHEWTDPLLPSRDIRCPNDECGLPMDPEQPGNHRIVNNSNLPRARARYG